MTFRKLSLKSLLNLNNFYILITFISFITKAECAKLRHDLEETPPKIFKIIERDNNIILENDPPRDMNTNKLYQFLKENADLEYRIHNILNQNKPNSNGLKKKFAKRIVAHSEETFDVQHNDKTNTYFKPLVRVHKTRNDDKVQGNGRINIEVEHKRVKTKTRPIYNTANNNGKTTETQHAIMHLSAIESQMKKVRSPSLRTEYFTKLNNLRREIEDLHKQVIDAAAMEELRYGAPFVEQGPVDEEDIHHTYTMLPGFTSPPENSTAQEYNCALYPEEPIWNYWTYGHTILQDQCPGDQVKIGDVCSWVPPHK